MHATNPLCDKGGRQWEIEEQWPIWELFQNGGVVLFRQPSILDDATDNLARNGYRVQIIDCQHHSDEVPASSDFTLKRAVEYYSKQTFIQQKTPIRTELLSGGLESFTGGWWT